MHAPDTFGRLLAAGITGVDRPADDHQPRARSRACSRSPACRCRSLSFGGTALVVTLAGIGVLASVARASAAAGEEDRGRAARTPSRPGRRGREGRDRRRRDRRSRLPGAGGGRPARREHGAAVRVRRVVRRARRRRSCRPPGTRSTAIARGAAAARASRSRRAKAPFVARSAPIGACRPVVRDADVVVGHGRLRERAGRPRGPPGARRPIVLLEQNAVPGLVNRVLARSARSVGVSFDATRAARFPAGRASR